MDDYLKNMAGNCLAARIKVLDRAISGVYNRAFARHGLKVTQVNILVTLAALGPTEVKPLCAVLSTDASTMSRALARIEKKGFIKSEPAGIGKILKISVTEEGLDVLKRVYPDWQHAQEQVAEMLGSDTIEAIRDAGNKLLRASLVGLPS